MRGVFLDLATYKPDDRHPALLKTALGDGWVFYESTPPEQVAERLQDADLLVSNKVRITDEVLGQCPDLKLIISGATGVDHIDLEAAKARGLPVCNIRDYSTESVAQQAFTLILALSNSLIQYHELVRSGAWQSSPGFNLLDYPLAELYGKTMGIIGYGAIGHSVERIAKGFGMDVLIAERRGADTIRDGRASFDNVITQSDVLSIHCPLSDETRDLIGEAELNAMKKTALLINVSRGGIVNELALVEALEKGEIAGAGFDVLSKEPPREGNPLLDYQEPNLIVTPHCAWTSDEARMRLFQQIVQIIEAFKQGEIMHNVLS